MNDLVALSELAEINPRGSQSRRGDLISFIGMGDVTGDGVIARCSLRPARAGYTPFREGDVLLAKITPCLENGKGAHAVGLPTSSGQASTEFHILRPRQGVNGRFLYHWTRSPELRLAAEGFMSGSAGQRRVPSEFFHRFRVPWFSYPKQRWIAKVLDAFDEALNVTRSSIGKHKQLRAGIVQSLLVSPSHTWQSSALGSIALRITSGSRGWATYYSNSGEIFLRIGNLSREHPNLRELSAPTYVRPPANAEEERTRCKPGDLLISITADLGMVGVVPSYMSCCYVNQHVARVRIDSGLADVRFVAHALQSSVGQEQFRVLDDPGAKAGLNLPAIAKLQVPLPPLSEQQRVRRILDDIDTTIMDQERLRDKLMELRDGTAADLLSDRVRTVAV